MDNRSPSRYGTQQTSSHSSKPTMPGLVYGLISSAIWIGVLLIAWPLLLR